jgi:hypothetical protein
MISVSHLASKKTIVIHVRCYENELANSLGILSDEYYINAIKKIFFNFEKSQDLQDNITSLLIVSDNIERANVLAKKLYNLFSLDTFTLDDKLSENNKFAFNILRNAKNLIISNSTFSWWGAYLGSSNLVVAPQKWYYKSAFSNGLYLKDWVTVEAEWI